VPPASSVRAGSDALTLSDDLVGSVTACLRAEGSIAVIAGDAVVPAVLDQLAGAGIAAGRLDAQDDQRVTVVPVSSAKGLEFDSVVLLEPAQIVAAEANHQDGLRRLYVAWTRAVSRLAVVHSQPLPAELAG
jgi:superfamily I DNA/RNA helicase